MAEPAASVMTPVKVPTVPCADAAPGQETAATNATAAKDGFDMPNLPRSVGDQPATESVDANRRVPYLELGRKFPQRSAESVNRKTIARPGGSSFFRLPQAPQ